MLNYRVTIKRWIKKQLIVVGVLLAGLLLFEVGLRIVGYSVPSLYVTDAQRGIALRPGAEGWWRKEGEAYIKINSDGLRDREHTKEKPPDTLRIAVLGDSWAEAFQVPMEKTFWAVMEKRLSECETLAGRKVEVINFGVSGYGTGQELITLCQRVWHYSPDIILLTFNGSNDVSDNSRALRNDEVMPYFIYRDGRLVLDSSFLNSPGYNSPDSTLYRLSKVLRDYSRVAQFAFDIPNAIKANEAARQQQQRRQQGAGSEPLEMNLAVSVYGPPATPAWNEAWTLTEALITLMHDEVEKRGAQFLVVTLNTGIQVHPDAREREQFVKRLGLRDLSYADERIGRLGEREGFKVFNLAPTLQAYADERKVYLHGFGKTLGQGHWNEEGHRVAGETIAQRLCEGIK